MKATPAGMSIPSPLPGRFASAVRPSEPTPNAEDDAHAVRVLAGSPSKGGGLAELPRVRHAEVGGELSVELVSEPDAGIDFDRKFAPYLGMAYEGKFGQ